MQGNFLFLVCKTNWNGFPLLDVIVYLFYTCHLQEEMLAAFLNCVLFRKACDDVQNFEHVRCPIEAEGIQFKRIVQVHNSKLMFNFMSTSTQVMLLSSVFICNQLKSENMLIMEKNFTEECKIPSYFPLSSPKKCK